MSTSRTTLARPDEPVAIHTRLFKGDDGWYYEVKIWKGDVDVTSAAPTTTVVAKKPYKTKAVAAATLLAQLAKVLRVHIV